jgi:hypothetical protein
LSFRSAQFANHVFQVPADYPFTLSRLIVPPVLDQLIVLPDPVRDSIARDRFGRFAQLITGLLLVLAQPARGLINVFLPPGHLVCQGILLLSELVFLFGAAAGRSGFRQLVKPASHFILPLQGFLSPLAQSRQTLLAARPVCRFQSSASLFQPVQRPELLGSVCAGA